MPAAQRLRLFREASVFPESMPDGVRVLGDDDNNGMEPCLSGRIHHQADHLPATDAVEDLGGLGVHAGAFARRKNHGRVRAHGLRNRSGLAHTGDAVASGPLWEEVVRRSLPLTMEWYQNADASVKVI